MKKCKGHNAFSAASADQKKSSSTPLYTWRNNANDLSSDTACSLLYQFKLVEHIRLKAALTATHTSPSHFLLHGSIVLCRLALFVSAYRIAAEFTEAGVEVLFGFLCAFAVGLLVKRYLCQHVNLVYHIPHM